MLLHDYHTVTKLTIASLSFFWLMVMFVPTAHAHSDAHASSVTTPQSKSNSVFTPKTETDSVPIVTSLQFDTEDHIFTDAVCITDCCKILAGAKVCANSKLSDDNIFFVTNTIWRFVNCLHIANSTKVDTSGSTSLLKNTLHCRILLCGSISSDNGR